jgi:hypothetical protein
VRDAPYPMSSCICIGRPAGGWHSGCARRMWPRWAQPRGSSHHGCLCGRRVKPCIIGATTQALTMARGAAARAAAPDRMRRPRPRCCAPRSMPPVDRRAGCTNHPPPVKSLDNPERHVVH